MASDEPNEIDKKTPETETSTPVADPGPAEVLDLEADAISDALEELTQLPPEALKTPRIKELLQSPDAPSRFMTILSIVFAILALAAFSLLIMQYVKHRASHKKVEPVVEKVVAEPVINETLGEFKMFLSPEKKEQVELRVEVVAECSTQAACTYLKDHIAQARDVVFPVFSAATKEELLGTETKNLIRRRIAERLNSIPMEGKVLQVHFSDMTIE